MSVADFIDVLARQGVELWFEGERLRFRAPKGALTEDQRGALSARREEVLGYLRSLAAGKTTTCRLSYSQQSLWFLHQQERETTAYHVAVPVRIASEINVLALTQALQALIDRHAILRTTYHLGDDGPIQSISALGVARLDRHLVPDIAAGELHEMLQADYRRPFDLVHGPVLRASLYTRGSADHVLLLTIHHIAVDALSVVVLFEDLTKLYAEGAGGPPAALGRQSVQYSDFVNWQLEALAGSTGGRAWSYWREKLAGPHEPLNLPTDYPRPALQTFSGASVPFRLGQEATQKIKDLARQEKTTPFVVMLASFKALLYCITGNEDLIIGTPTLGRSKPEFMRVVGDFVNSVPLRSQLTSGMTFRELVAQLRSTVLEALDMQDFPLPLLVERLHPARNSSRSPLFDTFFIFNKFEDYREIEGLLSGDESSGFVELGGLRLGAYALAQQEGQFDLAVQSMERAGTIQGVLKYRIDLFEERTVRELATDYVGLLEKVAAEPETKLGEFRKSTAAAASVLVSPRGSDEQNLASEQGRSLSIDRNVPNNGADNVAATKGPFDRQLLYWKSKLSGAPALLDLPTDHPRPLVQSFRGGRLDWVLDTALLDELRRLSQQYDATLFMTMLAAWKVLLHRYSRPGRYCDRFSGR